MAEDGFSHISFDKNPQKLHSHHITIKKFKLFIGTYVLKSVLKIELTWALRAFSGF